MGGRQEPSFVEHFKCQAKGFRLYAAAVRSP